MRTICIDPRTDVRWQQLVEHQQSDVFHSPQWIHVLTDTYDLDPRAYVVVDTAGTPLAGIPCCLANDMFGNRLVSLPFSDYCDPLATTVEQWVGIADALVQQHSPVALRCLHNHLPLADERFKLRKQAKWHGVDLHPDQETLWHNIHESSRRATRKAERDGVVVRAAQNKHDLRAFFELHLGVRKGKYRLLAQPFRFFEHIWDRFLENDHGVLLLAMHNGACIGSILFLEWKNTLYYKFNASSSTELTHRPNDLLVWEGIKYAKAKGCTLLDFGLSDWDQDGLVRYKRKFATQEKVISFLQYMPDVMPSPYEAPVRGLLGQLTNLLTDRSVPNHVTEKAGDLLYQFFV